MNKGNQPKKENKKKKGNTDAKEVPSSGATAADRNPATDFLIVGIGGSAGSFEEFQKFLHKMSANSGMAFIFVPHLDPTHESLMPELLDKLTDMSVRQVKDETEIKPNNVYIIPPNKTLTVEGGVLRLQPPKETRGLRLPIDAFFRSLAEDQNENAVAVVLSGSGSDGTVGIKAIKENGGVIFVQEHTSAKYDSMPKSAILTGLVDYVLPIDELPEKLVEFSEHRQLLHREKGKDGIRSEMEEYLDEICSILKRRTGHDFSNYKQNTLFRRIQRRIQVTQSSSVENYVEMLRADEENEAEDLFKDLLIGVTHFFRDTEAFNALREKVIPKIIENRKENEAIRVWVPGCATGEEAYSIAMILTDEMQNRDLRIGVQIFATDIDEDALATARNGVYHESFVEQIPPEFLEKFFVKQGSKYRIIKSLREACLFSSHNLIKHPPFSRLNLVSCRNLLIYLDKDLQKKIFPVFHYALRKGGFLFLGSSESIGGHTDMFRTIDKKNRIFQSKETLTDTRLNFPLMENRQFVETRVAKTNVKQIPGREPQIADIIQNILLENYSPSCVIVNERNEVVYFFGKTARYLEPVQGTPSFDILDMAKRGLRLDLRTALHKAIAAQNRIVHENITVESEKSIQRLNLIVRPLSEIGEDSNLYLVVFQDVGEPLSIEEAREQEALPLVEDQSVRQLEKELRTTKEHLQTTIEELETTNEELKSSNEELLSMNEELQSSNEELQTSKEEMQSINEELETVNTELRNKIEELDSANSDLQNLFQSTEIATIFLDNNLRIKRFTQATTELFNLIETDVGRPITDIVPRLSNFDLTENVEKVLNKLIPVEEEVQLSDSDNFYIMRVIPYRTVDNVIDGVVITFVDVTEIRTAQKQAEKRSRQQSAIAELGLFAVQNEELDPIFEKATSLACDVLDTEYTKILKLQPDGEHLLLLNGCGWDEGVVGKAMVETDIKSQAGFTLLQDTPVIVENLTEETRFKGPSLLTDHNVKSGMSVIIYGRKKPYGIFGVHTQEGVRFSEEEADFLQSFANIIAAAVQRDESLKSLRESEQRLSLAVEAGKMGTWEWDIKTDDAFWNDKLFELLGAESKGKTVKVNDFFEFVHPEDVEQLRTKLNKNVENKEDYFGEFRIIRADDKAVRWLVGQGKLILDDSKKPVKMVGVNYDITEQKIVQEKLEKFNEQLEQKVSERTDELNKLNLDLRTETKERGRLLRQLVTTQENERKRIARDIHDQLGQQLTALRLKLESLKNYCKEDSDFHKKIEETQEFAKELDADVGFLAWKLRPSALDDFGLATALENYINEWSKHFHIKIEFHTNNSVDRRFLPEIETNLYRIAQEALNNISKHSEAANVSVMLEMHDRQISLIVEDDGKGFNLEELIEESQQRGIGLSGMQERAELIGGSLEIETKIDGGTTIYVRVPDNESEDE